MDFNAKRFKDGEQRGGTADNHLFPKLCVCRASHAQPHLPLIFCAGLCIVIVCRKSYKAKLEFSFI